MEQIVPYVQMHRAGLAPEGRPVGVFLLLGPTGTGKTRTVEALAEVLHGTEKSLLKVDCGKRLVNRVARGGSGWVYIGGLVRLGQGKSPVASCGEAIRSAG